MRRKALTDALWATPQEDPNASVLTACSWRDTFGCEEEESQPNVIRYKIILF